LTGLTGRAMLEIMKVIAAYEAKSRFSELLREAAAGEVFIITRNGQKMAELRACQSEKPLRIRGMMKSEIPPVPPDFNEPLDLFAEYQ
jgi:antitoxin (DNA-binding transcriptional repressor) of toxin-antitoxin stability system